MRKAKKIGECSVIAASDRGSCKNAGKYEKANEAEKKSVPKKVFFLPLRNNALSGNPTL